MLRQFLAAETVQTSEEGVLFRFVLFLAHCCTVIDSPGARQLHNPETLLIATVRSLQRLRRVGWYESNGTPEFGFRTIGSLPSNGNSFRILPQCEDGHERRK